MTEHPHKNIVLIGFMGSGKSTIGRDLSRSLRYPLIDTDALIVQRVGKPITKIFADEGETAFRNLESAVLGDLTSTPTERHIISTGGGIITRPENRTLLRQLGYVVWLVVSPTEILHRTRRNKNRPLLNTNNPEEAIRALLEQRTPAYRNTAHLAIETDKLTFPEITTGIIESARYFFGQA
jgi:shikimate kinase